MSAATETNATPTPGVRQRDIGLRRRRAAEFRFKAYGIIAIVMALLALAILVSSVVGKGMSAFRQSTLMLSLDLDPNIFDPNDMRFAEDEVARREALFRGAAKSRVAGRAGTHFKNALRDALLRDLGLDPASDAGRAAGRDAYALVSGGQWVQLRTRIVENPGLIGQTVDMPILADGAIDSYRKGWIDRPEDGGELPGRLTRRQLDFADQLAEAGVLQFRFNTGLFVNTTATRSAEAGLAVAVVGSLQMMLIVLLVALPIGVCASIYLEEFAPKNRFTDLIEVNINNLAAVPSIVFGILGLAVFIQFMGLPRSAPIVGGLVLSLMTLPTIIIATRASLRAVPPSIRQAALGVGASRMQAVFHHVLPLAMPGIMTGAIIGVAQALGETAPLLVIGMDASVYELSTSPLSPSTSLPSQVYNWSKEATRGFVERTSAGIIILLFVLAILNFTAVLLRSRFERRW